jgi:hypothetical protein
VPNYIKTLRTGGSLSLYNTVQFCLN